MRMRKGWDTQADNGVRFARTPPKATPGLLAIIPAAARFLRLPVVLHMLALRPAS